MTAAQFLEMLIVARLRTYIYKGEFAYVHANLCFFTVSKKKEKSQHGKRELASSSACITSRVNWESSTTSVQPLPYWSRVGYHCCTLLEGNEEKTKDSCKEWNR